MLFTKSAGAFHEKRRLFTKSLGAFHEKCRISYEKRTLVYFTFMGLWVITKYRSFFRKTNNVHLYINCFCLQTRQVPVSKSGGWDKCLGPFDHYKAKKEGIDVWGCHDNCYTRVDGYGSTYINPVDEIYFIGATLRWPGDMAINYNSKKLYITLHMHRRFV